MDIVFPLSKQQHNMCVCVCVSAKTNTNINKQKRHKKKEIRENNKTRHVLQIVNNAKTTRILATQDSIIVGRGRTGRREDQQVQQTDDNNSSQKPAKQDVRVFCFVTARERESERVGQRAPQQRAIQQKHIHNILMEWGE